MRIPSPNFWRFCLCLLFTFFFNQIINGQIGTVYVNGSHVARSYAAPNGDGPYVGVGISNPDRGLVIAGNNFKEGSLKTVVSDVGAQQSPGLLMYKTRGTLLSPAPVKQFDRLGYLLAGGQASNGTQTYPTGISFLVDDIVMGSDVPVSINFETGKTFAGRTTRLKIASNGDIYLPQFANATDKNIEVDRDGRLILTKGAYQELSLNGSILKISDGNQVDLSTLLGISTSWGINTQSNFLHVPDPNTNVGIGTTSPQTAKLFVQGYKADGSIKAISKFASSIYTEARLASVFPSGLPMNLSNVAVLGIKHNEGKNGASIMGWNKDDTETNYAGCFIANGIAIPNTSKNYGLYVESENAAKNYGIYAKVPGNTNDYAAYLEGNAHIGMKGNERSDATIGVNSSKIHGIYAITNNPHENTKVIHGKYTHVGAVDAIAISGYSTPNRNNGGGFGFGGQFTGGYKGVYAIAEAEDYPGTGIGVHAIAKAQGANAGARYAIRGDVQSTHNTNNCWAAYLNGNVNITGVLTQASDKKLKRNIKKLPYGIEDIMKLKPKLYEYDQENYQQITLPNGAQYGFLAQDLEQILPALVKTTIQTETEKGKNDDIRYKAVNYIGLVPVLISALQEQQQQIEDLNKAIKEQETTIEIQDSRLQKIEALLNLTNTSTRNQTTTNNNDKPISYLAQNFPNPSSTSTTINFSLEKEAIATLLITNMNGQVQKRFDLGAVKGQNSQIVSTNDLSIGVYMYSLLLNDKSVDSKILVVSR